MTNLNRSRFRLTSAVVAIMLCVVLLMGTTYAWFTDSTASSSNVIKAGTLDVEMYWADGTTDPASATWTEATTGPMFNYDNWEPGYTVARHVRITNEGSLALKYALRIIPNGKYDVLANVIDVYFLPDATAVTERAMISEDYFVGTLADLINDNDGAAYGVLLPEGATATEDYEVVGSVTSTIVLKMSSTVSASIYQGASVGTSFDLKVVATQYDYESDDFGNDYDAGALLPDTWNGTADTSWYNETDTVFTLTSAEDLAGLSDLVDAGNSFEGKTIVLDADLDLYALDENGNPICFDPIGSYRKETPFKGTFDGNGHTISNLSQNTWALDNGYYYGDLGLGLFGKVEDATVKNVNVDNASISGESALCGVVAGAAYGDCTFENITVSNAQCNDYQYYAGGVVGWASGDHVYKNVVIDESTTIGGQWGDFGNSCGGIIGGASTSGTYHFEDCTVACRIDAVNDVVSAYQWYCYRNCGMLIGQVGPDEIQNTTATVTADNVTCVNVTVIYGEWANYTYCEFSAMSYPFVRVQAGVSVDAYTNVRYGHPTDANGNTVVDDNHVHNDGEAHHELIVFDQLFGGPANARYCYYGISEHPGVNVIYNNK